MHHRRIVLTLVLAVVAAALLLPAVAAGDDLRPGHRLPLRQGLSAERRDVSQQPRHLAARVPPRRHGRRRRARRGTSPSKLRAAGYKNVQARGGARSTSGRCAAPASRSAAATSSARSSPGCPAPTRTASPPRSSTWATASPPTTRASTSRGKIVARRQLDGQLLVQLPGRRGHQARRQGRHPHQQLQRRHRHGLPVRPVVRDRAGRAGRQRRRVRHEVRAAGLHVPAGRRLAQGAARRRHRRGHVREPRRHHHGRARAARATTWSRRCPASTRTARW